MEPREREWASRDDHDGRGDAPIMIEIELGIDWMIGIEMNGPARCAPAQVSTDERLAGPASCPISLIDWFGMAAQ